MQWHHDTHSVVTVIINRKLKSLKVIKQVKFIHSVPFKTRNQSQSASQRYQ